MDIRTTVPTIYGDWTTRFGESWKAQLARLKDRFSSAIEETRFPGEHPIDVPIVYVKKDSVIDVLRFMKEEADFDYGFLSDLTATDEACDGSAGVSSAMEEEPRFEVVYNLFSPARRQRIRVKTRVRDGEEVPTAVGLWKGANWAEREVYDMFGVKFRGHPDLRRILMDERWVGHPLRKDYPLKGYQLFPEPEPIHKELLD
jgi:NADH-quinone oxidoreductase subunit C